MCNVLLLPLPPPLLLLLLLLLQELALALLQFLLQPLLSELRSSHLPLCRVCRSLRHRHALRLCSHLAR